MPPVPASSVRGSPDFMKERGELKPNLRLLREVDAAIDLLKQNAIADEKIPKDRWPRRYLEKYGIRNLYRYGIGGGFRITYTLQSEETRIIVLILDVLSHPQYELLFGY